MSELPLRIVPFEVDGFQCKTTPEALAAKQGLLALCGPIKAIASDEQQDSAVKIVGQAKGYIAEAELNRKNLKAPFWNACVAIDGEAANFKGPLQGEVERIQKLLGNYQHEKKERAEAEQRRREFEAAEIARKAREAEEAQRRAIEAAERAIREAQEAKARAEQAKTAAAKRKAQEEADRLAEEQRKAEAAKKAADLAAMRAELDAAEANERASEIVPESAKPSGTRVTENEFDYEVTSVYALAKYCIEHRDASLLERILKIEPRKVALSEYVFFHCRNQNIPGVKVTPKTVVNVRKVMPVKTLE